MAWLLLSLLVVVLLVVSLLCYLTIRQGLLLTELLQRSTAPMPTHDSLALPVSVSPLMEPGSSWLPSEGESRAIEQRLRQESQQRRGSLRSRRTSTPTRA